MNTLTIKTSQFRNFHTNEFDLQCLELGDDIWLLGISVCNYLLIRNVSQAFETLDEDEKMLISVDPDVGKSPGDGISNGYTIPGHPDRKREMLFINESGFYAMAFISRKPEARRFRKWVTNDVLRSIRRDGFYRQRELDKAYINELEARIEQMKVGLERSNEQLWRVRHVAGNVSFAMYLDAARVEMNDLKSRRQIVGRLTSLSREKGFPVGRVRVRSMAKRYGSPVRSCHGRHPQATYPPLIIAEVLADLGFNVPVPTPDALELEWNKIVKDDRLKFRSEQPALTM